MRSNNRRAVGRLAALAVAASALVAFSMAGSANAVTPCPITITACGCTITTTGTYSVNKNLTAAADSVCIEIAAPNTVLEILNHATITGTNKTGTGVLVDSGAENSVVAGVKRDQTALPVPIPTPTSTPAPGDEANIVDFNTGIEVNADNTVVEFFNHLNNNHTAGLLLNNVANVTAGGFCANDNDGSGVVANYATGSRIYDFTAEKNGFDGALLNGASGDSIYNFTTILNKEDGVLVQGSSSNALTTGSSQSNVADGFRIGCDSSSSNPYRCDGASNNNHVTIVAAGSLSPFDVTRDNCGEFHSRPPKQTNGIHVEEDASSNTIAANIANSPGNNSNKNLLDDNDDCDDNNWTNNIYGTPSLISPPCTGNP
jgi:hypothetical protein